jgi:hypothetical protein
VFSVTFFVPVSSSAAAVEPGVQSVCQTETIEFSTDGIYDTSIQLSDRWRPWPVVDSVHLTVTMTDLDGDTPGFDSFNQVFGKAFPYSGTTPPKWVFDFRLPDGFDTVTYRETFTGDEFFGFGDLRATHDGGETDGGPWAAEINITSCVEVTTPDSAAAYVCTVAAEESWVFDAQGNFLPGYVSWYQFKPSSSSLDGAIEADGDFMQVMLEVGHPGRAGSDDTAVVTLDNGDSLQVTNLRETDFAFTKATFSLLEVSSSYSVSFSWSEPTSDERSHMNARFIVCQEVLDPGTELRTRITDLLGDSTGAFKSLNRLVDRLEREICQGSLNAFSARSWSLYLQGNIILDQHHALVALASAACEAGKTS